ncbi:hypothetical protein BXU11_05520 [Flavobacterium sp. LM5]|nr:hypothetical protein BXU11_05520 [Flavobacterium sp. LM5]
MLQNQSFPKELQSLKKRVVDSTNIVGLDFNPAQVQELILQNQSFPKELRSLKKRVVDSTNIVGLDFNPAISR